MMYNMFYCMAGRGVICHCQCRRSQPPKINKQKEEKEKISRRQIERATWANNEEFTQLLFINILSIIV